MKAYSDFFSQRRLGNLFQALFALLLSLALLLQTVPPKSAQAVTQIEPETLPHAGRYAPGVVLVGLRPQASLQGLLSSLTTEAGKEAQGLAVEQAEPVFPMAQALSAGQDTASPEVNLEDIYRLRLPAGMSVAEGLARLQGNPAVAFAEPDYQAVVVKTPNDPYFGDQWGLAQIEAPAAWDVTTGSSRVIAVIDSGLDTTHEDLSSQLWTNSEETPGNGLDEDGNGKVDDVHGWNFLGSNNDISDENGHGTQVAGVLAAKGNNGAGIAGVCWGCQIMPVKVVQSTGVVNYSDIAAAIAYAADKQVDVINLSLGGYADSETLHNAVKAAALSSVLVAGAGNDNKNVPFYPAAYPEVIAVTASDLGDSKAAFSNFGAWVDLAAPGANIQTTFAGNNGYGAEDGTSLATAFVSGLAGLIKSQHSDWSAAMVAEQMRQTAVDMDAANPTYAGLLGRGRIDASSALTTIPTPLLSVSGWSLDGQQNVRPAPGKSYSLALTLKNDWLAARNLSASLSTTDSYVTIGDASGFFGDINTGQQRENASDPFAISLAANTPYSHAIPFRLRLTGDGGFTKNIDFNLPVRSGVEHIVGGTSYAQDVTWTSDKSYVLDGNVVVEAGATLTIQPGTMIRANADKWLRVEGGLIAAGTADKPITFTTNDPGNLPWAGIRFTDTSLAAVFNAAGEYQSGSILRYVQISHAKIGIGIASQAPYIADSTFRGDYHDYSYDAMAYTDYTGIDTGTSAARIERNTFQGEYTAVRLGSGQATIFNNLFEDNYYGVSGNSVQAITENTFQNNSGTAIFFNGMGYISQVTIRDNRIIDNSGGITMYGAQGVDIQHNLVSGNGSGNDWMGEANAAINITADNDNSLVRYPSAAVYNPDRGEYLLFWYENLWGNRTVKYQRRAADGQALGRPQILGLGWMPQVAYNPTSQEYLVAWITHDNARNMDVLMAQRLTGETIPVSGPSELATSSSLGSVGVAYEENDAFLVVWSGTDPLDSMYTKVTGKRLQANGTWSAAFELGSGLENPSLQDVVYDESKAQSLVLMLGSTNISPGCYGCIFGAWVSAGSTTPSTAFFAARSPNYDWIQTARVAGNHQGEFAITWTEPGQKVYAQLLDETSTISDTQSSAAQVFTGAGNADSVSPAEAVFLPVPGQYLLTWISPNREWNGNPGETTAVYKQILSATGEPVGTFETVSSPKEASRYQPILAANPTGNEVLAVWGDWRTGESMLYGQRLDGNGGLLDNAWSADADESDPAVNFPLLEGSGIRENTIINNRGAGMSLGGSAAPDLPVKGNNWFGNENYDLWLSTPPGTQTDVSGNYWGAVANSAIPSRIYDCNDTEFGCSSTDTTIGKALWSGALSGPDQAAPAFVAGVTVDPDPVGIQRGSFEVNFSRPMDTTTTPSLSFHDARRGTVTEFNGQFKGETRSLSTDQYGRVLVGTYDMMGNGNFGLYRYDGSEWSNLFEGHESLCSPGVRTAHTNSNGNLWIYCDGSNKIFQISGSTWITHTVETTGIPYWSILDILEDGSGNTWFSTENGLLRFDGQQWQAFKAKQDGMINRYSDMALDRQNRMWFRVEGDPNVGQHLERYDGSAWKVFDTSNKLPNKDITTLFGDSQGRIWIGFYRGEGQTILAMVDGDVWSTYTYKDIGLSEMDWWIQAILEDPQGNIWVAGSDRVGIYDGKQWTGKSSYLLSSPLAILAVFDKRGDLWSTELNAGASPLRVLWGGEDFSVVDDSQWVSPTTFRATYDFTPLVPQGNYAFDISDATGMDGMEIAPDDQTRFEVAYAGYVTDETPPSMPTVSAISDGSLTELTVRWSSSDPQGLAQFRYALGTTPGGKDVLDWLYVPASTSSVRLTGLLLEKGQTYYASVAAQNFSGLWSQVGVSNPVIAGERTRHNRVYLPMAVNK